MSNLFGQPDEIQRRSNRALVAELKARHGIVTFSGEPQIGWLAIAVPACHELLKVYRLTPEEIADPMSMFVGYCRLIDEAGLCQQGERTELECVEALVRRLE